MKPKLTKILLTLAAVLLLNSCVGEDFKECAVKYPLEKADVYINLSVGILDQLDVTKTRADDATDDKNFFEGPVSKYEKMKTLRVIIVRGKRTSYVEYLKDSTGYVEHNHLFVLNENGVARYDDMIFKVRGGEEKKIYFIVNEDLVSEQTGFNFASIKVHEPFDESDIADIEIDRLTDQPQIDNQATSTQKYYIPMSESYLIDVPMPQNYDETISYGRFFVTRAAVKCSFNVRFTSNEYSNRDLYLKKIIFNGFGEKEYFLPNNTEYSELIKDPISGLEGKFIMSYTTPADLVQSSYTFDCEIPFSDSQVSFSPSLYFPESKADTDYSVSVVLDVKNKLDQFANEEIVLPSVTLPNLPALPRNTHVVVNMTLTDHSIEDARVTVFPYTAVNLKPTFGFGTESEAPGSISETEIELIVGQSATLTASFNLTNTADKNLIWVTSDSDIVTVSPAEEEGVTLTTGDSVTLPSGKAVKITAKKEGKATITVYAQNGQTVTCNVTVKNS